MLHIGFEEVYPLWALSTPDVGGLGWEIFEIGTVRMPCDSACVWLDFTGSFCHVVGALMWSVDNTAMCIATIVDV